jgi:hypothetical protein
VDGFIFMVIKQVHNYINFREKMGMDSFRKTAVLTVEMTEGFVTMTAGLRPTLHQP